ncbi:AAA family ATPase [Pseudothermotoga sp. U03pept]|uniref:ATP-dependent DNA helicase n=1 Tax=Pseudothermotoga sp. U03pept TaxID=3447012 RepID=UPI003F057E79
MQKIELNEEFLNALKLMEDSNKNIFITGRAGTGKSTLLKYFREKTKKRIVVLAPTGVAALNVNGETIHSFFGFKPDITLEKVQSADEEIYKHIDAVVIDEISMVRADLFDCIDRFLRLNARYKDKPFGGVQMILIGDLYQLPPVVKQKEKELFTERYESKYFFDSDAFRGVEWEFIELKKIYRQEDQRFIRILNEIRNNTVSDESLSILNSRVGARLGRGGYTVCLTAHNETARKINEQRLSELNGRLYIFHAQIVGNFDEDSFPADYKLLVKKGAQIMMLNNDADGRWVNGTVGKVTGVQLSEDGYHILVQFPDQRIEEVTPHEWDIFHYSYNRRKRQIETKIVGSFKQYPLKLAWAVTIHKSQGKTFDNVIIDLSKRLFAPGQLYVALSRCRSLDGISLTQEVRRSDVMVDRRIVYFLSSFQQRCWHKQIPLSAKLKLIDEAMKEKKYIRIVYLDRNNQTTGRVVKPVEIGEFSFQGKSFHGLRAYCLERKEMRTFRTDRILSVEKVQD